MAFTEAGEPAQDDPSLRPPALAGMGLAYDWEALARDECPRCGADLVEFEHLTAWKCPCGFRITAAEKIREHGPSGRAYRVGIYENESPF